jgi:hypothetical protein
MSTTQERAIARTEAVAIAERIGVETGQIANAIAQLPPWHPGLHTSHNGAVLAAYVQQLAQQVSALAGAVEQLATYV